MKVFIEPYYTRARLHSALGHRPPEEFEHAVAPGMPAGAATMEFFHPTEGADTEGGTRVKNTVRPTGAY
jgi:hypothetical protein